MKTLTTRRIAITAVFIALLAVFSFTPLGMLPIIPGVIDTAFLLIMIVTLAAQLEGLFVGVVCSTTFGIFSLIRSFMSATVTAPFFQNPLISVVPRIIMGITAYYSFALMKKATANSGKNFVKNQLPSLVGAVVAVVTNTALVLGFMALGYGASTITVGGEAQTVLQFVTGSVLLINFPVEIAANVILTPILYTVISKYAKRGN